MSCYHRYGHGCDFPVPPQDWYDAYGYRPRRYRDDMVLVRDDDEYYDDERPLRRRSSGQGRRRAESTPAEEVTPASLQSRAEALREELIRIEEDLAKLAPAPGRVAPE